MAAEAEADTARNMIRLLTKALDSDSETVSQISDGTTVTITGNEGMGRNSIIPTVTDVNGNVYNDVVLLDTNIFNGYKQRNWGIPLRKFVYNNLIGQKIKAYNDDGSYTVVEFAKKMNEQKNQEKRGLMLS